MPKSTFGSDFWVGVSDTNSSTGVSVGLPQSVTRLVAPFVGNDRERALKRAFSNILVGRVLKPLKLDPSFLGDWLDASCSITATGETVERYHSPDYATKFSLANRAEVGLQREIWVPLPAPFSGYYWIPARTKSGGVGLRYGPVITPGIKLYVEPRFAYDPSQASPWAGEGEAAIRGSLDLKVAGEVDIIVATAQAYGGISLDASAGGLLRMVPEDQGAAIYGQVKVDGEAKLIGGVRLYVWTWQILEVPYTQTLWEGSLIQYPSEPGLIFRFE